MILDRIAREVRNLSGVDYTLTSVADDDQRIANAGTVYVRMAPLGQRRFDQFEMMNYVREEILPPFRQQDLRISVSPAAVFSGGGMSQADVQFMIGGPDMKLLDEYSQKVMQDLRQTPGAVDVDSSLVVGKPQYGVTVDRAKAADLGVSIADVANTLRLLVAGDKASDYNEKGEQYEVHVRATAAVRNRLKELEQVSIPSSKKDKEIVALGDVVTFAEGTGPAQINRLNRNRQVTISCNMTPGTSQQAILDQIERSVQNLEMGPDYTTGLLGKSKEMAKTFRSFIMVFVSALGLRLPGDCGPVRVVAAPDHDPALAAVDAAFRPDFADSLRAVAEHFLAAGHPGAVCGGEEELDLADRPHEPAPRRGHSRATRPSWRPTVTGCARSS